VLTHAGALQRAGIPVLGLVGRDANKARQRADRLGVPHAFTNLADALALGGVTIVAVTTPPHTHAPITLAAISAGKHVLCEKPFALNVTEAKKMLEAAQQAGVIHVLGTEYRFSTPQAVLRRVIASGAIGDPREAIFMLQMPSLMDPSTQLPDWWESASDGGGWLGAAGSHTIDQVRSTLGEFETVSASLQKLSPRPAMTADDTYTVHFRLVGGCTGVLHGSCAIAGPSLATSKVAGTRGCVWVQSGGQSGQQEVWLDAGSGPQRVPDPDDLPQTPPEPPEEDFLPSYSRPTKWHTTGGDIVPYTRLYQRLGALVRGESTSNDPPVATFADGVASQAVLDAVRRAAADGGSVEVDQA
jgi:predicted dehydrogenase